MTVDELKKHGGKYSQSFKFNSGLWKENFDAMASKTTLKLLLSKYAPLSVEMQKAVISDQSVINDVNATDVTYIDNEEVPIDHESKRIELMVEDCKTIPELQAIENHVTPELRVVFELKNEQLLNEEKILETKKETKS